MQKPVLVILAAGMGSRYGGLKQIDPIDNEGHILMDFSLFDAKRAGFEKVIFIIKKENEADFKAVIGNRMEKHMEVAYAYQALDMLPAGFAVPEGRVKPWGTSHAILCAADQIDGPFAVINADDYYGRHAFSQLYEYLETHTDDEKYRYAMIGYRLKNTVTDHGSVARGICSFNADRELTHVTERTCIEKRADSIAFSEDGGKNWTRLDENALVSMNMWGFTKSILTEIKTRFPAFLEKGIAENPLKCEYLLPTTVSTLLEEGCASVKVLESTDTWYGVTYREDKSRVVAAMQALKDAGLYSQNLWEDDEHAARI